MTPTWRVCACRWGTDRPSQAIGLGVIVAGLLAVVNLRPRHQPTGLWRRVRAAVDDLLAFHYLGAEARRQGTLGA